MKLRLRITVALLTLVPFCIAVHFPGFSEFQAINQEILNGIANDNIQQKIGRTRRNVTTEVLCTALANQHNKVKRGRLRKTNRQFLRLKNPLGDKGFHAVSFDACNRALTKPTQHKDPLWIDEYAGFHIGKRQKGRSRGATVDKGLWYVGRNGYQMMHSETACKRCDCSVKDPTFGSDCSWSFQYTDPKGKIPYVQRWDGGTDGASLGFPISLRYIGYRHAECIVWIGLETACLQCFNAEKRPYRTTMACSSYRAQYLIKDEE